MPRPSAASRGVKKDLVLPKAAAKAATSSRTVSGKSLNAGAASIKFKDPFKGCPQASCDTCKQSSSNLDRQSRPDKPKLVYWVQSRWSATLKKKVPSGKECYPCFFVRRKHFNMIEQKVLNDKQKAQPEIDDKVLEVRADHVGEYGKFKKEGWIDVDALVVKEASSYDDRFVEGSFEPLWEFAEKRQLKADDEQSLIALITSRYPSYTVGYDEAEILGVDVPDSTGAGYRYRRGAKQSLKLKLAYKQPDSDAAKETFTFMSEKAEVDRIARQLETTGDNRNDGSTESKATSRR